jgi:acyl-CoA synthetase (AMP-forming)/AMP-acid ligase II
LALYLGILRLGATYVPLNPSYTKRETEHFVNVNNLDIQEIACILIIQDAKPKVMITLNQKEDASFAESTGDGPNVKHVLCEQQLAKVYKLTKH